MSESTSAAAIDVMRRAGGCDDCFRLGLGLERPLCDVAQPRWVGVRYASSSPRIAVVLINPGGGNDLDPALTSEAATFREFHTTGDYEPIRAYFAVRLARGVRWLAWYRDVLGLRHDDIAQLNVAWCATREDRYPARMLNNCFDKYTKHLLRALDPDVVLLSGSEVHRFEAHVRSTLPRADVVPTMHYANRRSKAEQYAEAARVRARIDGWRADRTPGAR